MKKKIFIRTLFFILAAVLNFNVLAADRVRMSEDEIREVFVDCAMKYLGTPYVYKGESKKGLDCSGLVYVSARDAGIGKVPHSSQTLYNECKSSDKEPKRGDLIFFAEDGRNISHVGIWLGGDEFIHAASAGRKTGVIITKLSETTMASTLVGYKALITADTVVMKDEQKPQVEDIQPEEKIAPAGDETVSEEKKEKVEKEHKFAKALIDNCSVEGSITFDWSFIKPTDIDLFMQGVSVEAGIRLDRWTVNPGVLLRLKFMKNNTNVKDRGIYGGVIMPLCLSVSYDKFMAYGGIVAYIPGAKENLLYGTDIKLEPQLWPGMFGVAVNLDLMNIGKAKISLYQDLNYVCLRPGVSHPTNQQLVSGGFNMSSGVKVSF